MSTEETIEPMRPGWEALSVNQRQFLVALESEIGHISRAAALCGLGRSTHYDWLKTSEEYRLAVRDLDVAINERIMRELFRRGVEGIDEPVFFQGKQVATKRAYDTPALIALAKARMPKRFRENWRGNLQVDGGVDAHIRHEALLAPEFLEQMLEAANKLNKLTLGNEGYAP